MHSLTHILVGVKAFDIKSPEFIFGLTAPDIPAIFPTKKSELRYHETHDADAYKKIKNKDLALGFASHYTVDVMCHNHGEWERGFTFYTHNVPEYLVELWSVKNNPHVFDIAKRMYSINVNEVSSDMAQAFQKDYDYTKSLVERWLAMMGAIHTFTRVIKYFMPNMNNMLTNGLDKDFLDYVVACTKLEK